MRLWSSGVAIALSVIAVDLANGSGASPNVDDCGGYSVSNIVEGDLTIQADLDLIGEGCAVYGPDVAKLRLLVEYQTDSRVHVLIQDCEGLRYQVPEDVFPRPSSEASLTSSDSLLSFKFGKKSEPFSFQVVRKETSEVLFDTLGSSLVFERQFLRVKTWLPSDPNLYGLGEHSDPFRLINKDYTRTFWARDSGAIPHQENLYGSHPIYFEQRTTGTHGVLLMTSNGMDINLDQDDKGRHYLEYLTTGGVLDFYFLAGPNPVEVSRQTAALMGTPAMVPYWSLGFHQCRFGYEYWFDVAEVVHNYSAAEIPLETMWTDIDYMDRRQTFSLDPDRFPISRMHDLITYLRDRQQRYILMIDPAVADKDYPAFNRGVDMDIFVKKNSSSLFRGAVWPGVTVFPDWFHPNTTAYWIERFEENFNPTEGVDIDGVWIDMNEPANMCSFPCDDPEAEAERLGLPPASPPKMDQPRPIPGFPGSSKRDRIVRWANTWFSSTEKAKQSPLIVSTEPQTVTRVEVDHDGDDLLSPPYRIHNHHGTGELSDMTVRTDTQHATGQWEYDVHNIYGTLMSLMTRKAMLTRRPGLRPFIITRSTFAGAGRYVGKWLGDNVSTWDHYRVSIAGMLNFASIFQVPMVGTDVCGFLGSTNEELCSRWATLGAFSPFFRNHNDQGSLAQEFYRWPAVAEAAKYAISVRYRLLDYLYTALIKQSSDGTPAINPLWYLYPQDSETFPIDLQFFYGNCLLVSPVTEEGAKDVSIYLPDDVFYDFETRKKVRGHGAWVKVKDVAYDRIPLHVRGGCVIPLRTESANTTTELRKKGFELFVAPGLDGTAQGSLYVDDGVSLDGGPDKTEVVFNFADGVLKRRVVLGSDDLHASGIDIEKVTVLGVENVQSGISQHREL